MKQESTLNFNFFLLAASILICGCKTIVIPLPGTHIMKPRAGLATVGVRFTSGVAEVPNVEATVDEVKDNDGNAINPLPGTTDVTTSNKTKTTTAVPLAEIAVDFNERFEIGLSSERGAFFMYDYALWSNAALTITPSYSTIEVEGGDASYRKTSSSSSSAQTSTVDHGYKGRARNLNVTQLASCWIGDIKWAAAYLYAGLGLNSFETSIKGNTSDLEKKNQQVAPTALFGISLRLFIFDLTTEAAATNIKYRDGTTKTVPTMATTGSIHLAF